MQPNKENVALWIKLTGCQYPDIAFRQMQLESGNLTSHICKENNNLFGMMVSTRRPTTCHGENHGFAVYSNWIESIIDYRMYQIYCRVPAGLTNYGYAKFLQDHHYWEDQLYIQKLLR